MERIVCLIILALGLTKYSHSAIPHLNRYFDPKAAPNKPKELLDKTDILMVDTGQPYSFRGVLNLDPSFCTNSDVHFCQHGLRMAIALEDQLTELNAKPINVVQLPWNSEKDIINDILIGANTSTRVMTLALSGQVPIKAEENALRYASSKNILILAAAGNDGLSHPAYPSSYKIDCLISVSTSINLGTGKPEKANSGEIAIPMYDKENGTSFSTARAGGIAAKYFQDHPKASCKEAKAWMVSKYRSGYKSTQLER